MNFNKFQVCIILVAVVLLLSASLAVWGYTMGSPNYRIQTDSINVGGGRATSTDYIMEDSTLGDIFHGVLTSLSYKMRVGYQPSSELCNNNGVCETDLGETSANCPADCGCDNDGVCETERGEDYTNCPLDCPVPGGEVLFRDAVPPSIYNISVDRITLKSAEVSWKTNEKSYCKFCWGKTDKYEIGEVSEPTFYLEHSVELNNLSPDTLYYFRITCRDTNQNETGIKGQRFTTLALPDIIPPANVSSFEAIPGDKQITLKWKNPPDKDFKGVKIMRSTEFYPSNPWIGTLIYTGIAENFVDTGLENDVGYYYTAFTYDKSGNYSSGAVAWATPQAEIPLVKPPAKPPVKPPVRPVPPEIEKLTLEDFEFWQEGKKISLIEKEKIKAKSDKPFTISIDYEKVPEVLKTIMITLEKDNKYFSFLLRINKEKTKYLATLIPPAIGECSLMIDILDFKNQALKKISAQLEIEKTEVAPLPAEPWYRRYLLYIYVLAGIIVLAIIIKVLSRKY